MSKFIDEYEQTAECKPGLLYAASFYGSEGAGRAIPITISLDKATAIDRTLAFFDRERVRMRCIGWPLHKDRAAKLRYLRRNGIKVEAFRLIRVEDSMEIPAKGAKS